MSYKDGLQQMQEKRNEIAELKAENLKQAERIAELLRAITLKNRAYKVLEKKYMKLRKDKQVDTLRAYIEKIEKQLKKAGLR